MSRGCIEDTDLLYRHTLFPLMFSKKEQFQRSKWMRFVTENGSGALLSSLAWHRYVPTHKLLHAHGCRLAAQMNAEMLKKRGVPALERKDRRIYCGAYALQADAIRALVGAANLPEIAGADVMHLVERGEIAHAAIRINLAANTKDVDGTKTAILDRLWNSSRGPLSHVCECDRDVGQHPGARLEVPPAGSQVQQDGFLLRIWQLVRFYVVWWLWQRGYVKLPTA